MGRSENLPAPADDSADFRMELGRETRLALAMNCRMMQLPYGAVCGCGETFPVCLLRTRGPVLCFECAAVERGLEPFEDHHIGGRPSPLPPVRLPCNRHALATWLQGVLWRQDGHAAGSPYAIAFDLGVLAGMRVASETFDVRVRP